ncbi:MAG: MgtC/SapB family protein [Acidobacteriaceae bacterium]|nr:MgtC/SapB family protein [Acidobacteriaceae bacterium]
MIVNLPIHFSTIEQVVFLQGTTTRLLMACAMGGLIGMEREWRHKASGLRTNMLLCMGCALFTVLSGVLAGAETGDKSRVASNIVQGIGFLGAGLILHTRNRVLGLTSAATVFVVASIGMACGAGLYVEAAIATAIVFIALRFIGVLETRSGWKRYPMLYEVRGSDEGRMFTAILAVLDREQIRLNIVERDRVGDLDRVTFTLLASGARHSQLLAELVASDATDQVVAFRDEEED